MKRRSPDAMVRTLDDEAVILHVPSGEYFSLNEVGLFIWQHLDGENDLDGVTDQVTGRYEVDRETARRDVAELISAFEAADLLVDVR